MKNKVLEKALTEQAKSNNLLIILTLGFLTALAPFSIDMYLPSFPSIAHSFKTNISKVGLSLTAYFFGVSFGQLIYGPLLDRFGRKKPLIFGLIIYLLATTGCLISPSINIFIGMRLLTALGGCVGLVASRAMVRDLFPASEMARVLSTLMLIMGVAPIIAPTIGGYVSSVFGWYYIFVILIIISTLLLISVITFLPETKKVDSSVSLKLNNIFYEYFQVIKTPEFIVYTLAGGLSSAGLFAYVSGSPFVYMKLFDIPEKQYGLFFGLNSLGLIFASQVNRFVLKKIDIKKVIFSASLVQFISVILISAGNTSGLIYKLGTISCIFVYLFCHGFLNPNTTALALQPFNKNAGSASALLGSIQMFLGSLTSMLVSYLQNGTQFPMVYLMTVSCLLSFGFIIYSNFKIKNNNFS